LVDVILEMLAQVVFLRFHSHLGLGNVRSRGQLRGCQGQEVVTILVSTIYVIAVIDVELMLGISFS
jgi:hypothetical protein